MGDDVRFKNHGLAPKSTADFPFLLHGFHFLKDQGVMAIILPHGVLFRGGVEERIPRFNNRQFEFSAGQHEFAKLGQFR